MLKKFVLGGMVVVAALLGNACGGDDSSDSSPVLAAEESSSSVDETLSSSTTGTSSSSVKDKESSSSVKNKASSSSEKSARSSSSKDTEPGDKSSSSMKNGGSSSSAKTKESSSSEKKEVSSSSEKPVESSSSEQVEESSSSEKSSSSSAKSSSSEYSSSSVQETSSSSSEESSSSSFVGCIMGSLYDDRDGKTYKTVKIGEQEWMAENLNYDVQNYESSYRSWCYDNKDGKDGEVDNCQKYGRLYRWSVVIDSLTLANDSAITCGCRKSGEGTCTIPDKWKGICPNGWHIPTQNEWGDLVKFVGGSDVAGKKIKSSGEWNSIGGLNGTDEFCFAGLPAGYRSGSASYSNDYMYFWTADQYESGSTNAYAMYAFYKSDFFSSCFESTCVKAFPIRCIKN